MKSEIAFITGYQRSGTSWMANLMNELEEVHCLWEGRLFFGDYIPSLYECLKNGIHPWYHFIVHRKNNWLQSENIIETIDRKNFITKKHYDEKLNDVVGRITALFTTELMIEVAKDKNIKYIMDKTPSGNPGDITRLRKNFPGSKIIFMKRNVKNVMISSAFTHWRYLHTGEMGIEPLTETDFLQTTNYINGKVDCPVSEKLAMRIIDDWMAINEEASKLKNVLIINYEDLYNQPIITFNKVCKFLEIKITETKINNVLQNTGSFEHPGNVKVISNAITLDNSLDKWKSFLTEKISDMIDEKLDKKGIKL